MFALLFNFSPSSVGKHIPSKEPKEVEIMQEVDIVELMLAYDERINRMIPAPSGLRIYDSDEEQENPNRVVEVNINIKL